MEYGVRNALMCNAVWLGTSGLREWTIASVDAEVPRVEAECGRRVIQHGKPMTCTVHAWRPVPDSLHPLYFVCGGVSSQQPVRVRMRVTLRLTVGRSVCLVVEPLLGLMTRCLLTV
jgi:hypothetical protein